MKTNQNNNNQSDNIKNKFDSNPEKSFDAGKKGGPDKAVETSNQSSGTINSSGNSGSSESLGNASRVQQKPTQGEGWQSPPVNQNQSGKKEGQQFSDTKAQNSTQDSKGWGKNSQSDNSDQS